MKFLSSYRVKRWNVKLELPSSVCNLTDSIAYSSEIQNGSGAGLRYQR